MISDNVFSQFMYKTLPTCNHLWVFKKQFCTQVSAGGGCRVWAHLRCVHEHWAALLHPHRSAPSTDTTQ
jgi:hypothetical protein